MNITVRPIRKPLLYPSELRGHGRATLVHRFDLREQALALSKVIVRALATEFAAFQKRTPHFGPLPRPGSALVAVELSSDRSTSVRLQSEHATVPRQLRRTFDSHLKESHVCGVLPGTGEHALNDCRD